MSGTPGKRRRNSRAALHARRSAPLPKTEKPVLPGQSSGNFKILSDADIEQIHASVLEVLETIGMAQAIPSCVEMVCAAGGSYTDEGRLLFPPKLVERALETCARDFTLHGQIPDHDLDLSGSRLHFGTAGAAVHIADPVTGEYRDSSLKDLYQIGRIVDQMEHIHYFQRPLVARDMVDPSDLDLNTIYASVSATTKHVGSSWVMPEHVTDALELLHLIAGSEQAWRERPFVSMSCCFAVPPLRFAEDACYCLETAVKGGMPVLLLAAGQAGATSPASLAGSIVQSVSEVLAGLVYVNLLQEGHPAVFGTWPFVSDLRTGAMSGGSGEQAILMAGVAQMGRHYGLVTGVASGMTDAKLPDAQSGYEKGYTNTLAAHSGANLLYESAGMQASLLGCCYESYIIDNDMLGSINRTVRGIEVTPESVSIDAMRDVCQQGPNHYLGHAQTLELMQKEYLYPEIANRDSPTEWLGKDRPDIITSARNKVDSILANHFPAHISEATDQQIRERFNIQLPRSIMHA